MIICPFSRFNLYALFALSFSINITTNHVNFSSLDNDDMKPSKRQVSFISLFLFQIKLIELAILTNQRFFKRNALSIFLFGFVTQAFESTTIQNDFCFLSIWLGRVSRKSKRWKSWGVLPSLIGQIKVTEQFRKKAEKSLDDHTKMSLNNKKKFPAPIFVAWALR